MRTICGIFTVIFGFILVFKSEFIVFSDMFSHGMILTMIGALTIDHEK